MSNLRIRRETQLCANYHHYIGMKYVIHSWSIRPDQFVKWRNLRKTFLGALAKRGASNSLILPEEEDEDQGKTLAFFAIEGMLLGTLWIFWFIY